MTDFTFLEAVLGLYGFSPLFFLDFLELFVCNLSFLFLIGFLFVFSGFEGLIVPSGKFLSGSEFVFDS